VYEHDLDDIADLGWAEFILRQWESIYIGYRSWSGLRKTGRRWSDLIEAGLDCSQDIADRLVRDTIINGPDRRLEGAADADVVVRGMVSVLADMQAALASMDDLEPADIATLRERHARLLALISAEVLGEEDD
jgi:hypothetical protein